LSDNIIFPYFEPALKKQPWQTKNWSSSG